MGFIPKSVIFAGDVKNIKNAQYIEIDKKLYDDIDQGVVLIKQKEDSKTEDIAKIFYDFVISEECKQIFKNFGYEVE